MIRLLIIAASLLMVYAQNTTTAKPTPEPGEKEYFRFNYEVHTHKMTLSTGSTCYIFNLSDGERTVVHTDYGLRTLELKLLASLTTATMVEVQKQNLPHRVVGSCGRGTFTHFYSVSPV